MSDRLSDERLAALLETCTAWRGMGFRRTRRASGTPRTRSLAPTMTYAPSSLSCKNTGNHVTENCARGENDESIPC